MHAAEAAAFDHRRPAHADARVVGGDDDVAAAQQRRIAGKAAAMHDADHRHLPRQPCEALEGADVQPGHDDGIDIARPAAAAFGQQHQRQRLGLGDGQDAVALVVVEVALRAGQHRVVVGHHRDPRALCAEQCGVDAAGGGDQPVGRGVALQVVDAAAAALRRHREGAIFEQAAFVQQIGQVLARAARAQRMAPRQRLGARCVIEQRAAVEQPLQIGARHVRVGRWCHGRCRHRRRAGLQLDEQVAFTDHVAHGRGDRHARCR